MAGIGQMPREDAAAAAGVDDARVTQTVSPENGEKVWCDAVRQIAEAAIVDVRQVRGIQ